MYTLKPNVPDFEVVDGPMAGRKFEAGKVYKEIPPQEAHKFIFTAEDAEDTEKKDSHSSSASSAHSAVKKKENKA